MRLEDLVKPIEECSDEELRERLAVSRRRQMVERPAAKKHVEKAQKKESKKKVAPIRKLLDTLTPDQLALLLKEHEQ